MAKDGSVLVKILGDISDLSKKLKAGETDIKGFSAGVQSSLKSGINDSIDKLTGKFGALGNAANSSLKNVAGSVASVGAAGVVATAGVAALAAGIAALAVAGVKSFVGLADKVRRFQQVTGSSAEESSALVAVMDDMKIEADAGAAAMFKLSKSVSTNEASLAKHGITLAENKDGTTDLIGTLLNVADAYKRVGGGVEGNKIAMDAFGKSGAALIPLLEQGRTAIEQMFTEANKHDEILSDDDLKQARAYELAMDDLGDAVGGLQREIGQDLVPAIAAGARALATIVDWANKATDAVKKLHVTWDRVLGVFASVVPVVGAAKVAFDGLRGKTDDTAGATEDLGISIVSTLDALKDQREATDDAAAALDNLVDSTLAVFNADLRYADATNDVEDALDKLKKTAQEVGVNTEDYGRATTDAAKAALGQAAASALLAKDQADLSGATFTASDKTRVQRAELQKVADTLAPGSRLRVMLDEYIARLDAIPGTKSTVLELTTVEKSFANSLSGGAIPGYAQGGIVGGPAGKPQLAVVHGGEEVLTLAQQRAGAITNNWNIYNNVDLGDALWRMQRVR